MCANSVLLLLLRPFLASNKKSHAFQITNKRQRFTPTHAHVCAPKRRKHRHNFPQSKQATRTHRTRGTPQRTQTPHTKQRNKHRTQAPHTSTAHKASNTPTKRTHAHAPRKIAGNGKSKSHLNAHCTFDPTSHAPLDKQLEPFWSTSTENLERSSPRRRIPATHCTPAMH